ncbi:uncharacterized protein map3k14b [Denticeps clupeoides]|uniref:Protein kinase domain-containing protein n=1 Tax=Denticeps clupeoides TaxID=299321 RepID=A0AAY4DYL5_9TELE|nr:uncharacterized protein LOC114784909 [Denticeps clupeoides]
MLKAGGMAIPTMFNATTTILDPGALVLSCLEEEDLAMGAGNAASEVDPVEPCCTSIIAEEEGDGPEEFSPCCLDFYSRPHCNTRTFLDHFSSVNRDQPQDCCQRTHKKQKRKTSRVRERLCENETRLGDMRKHRRKVRREFPELESSSDEGSGTFTLQQRIHRSCTSKSLQNWSRAPLYVSPSLDSLASLLSVNPEGKNSASPSCRDTESDFGCLHSSTKAELGSDPSDRSHSLFYFNMSDYTCNSSKTESMSDSSTVSDWSRSDRSTASDSSYCSVERSFDSLTLDKDLDSRSGRAMLDQEPSYQRVEDLYGSSGTDPQSESSSFSATRSFDSLCVDANCRCLCVNRELNSDQLDSSCYSVKRSFDSLVIDDVEDTGGLKTRTRLKNVNHKRPNVCCFCSNNHCLESASESLCSSSEHSWRSVYYDKGNYGQDSAFANNDSGSSFSSFKKNTGSGSNKGSLPDSLYSPLNESLDSFYNDTDSSHARGTSEIPNTAFSCFTVERSYDSLNCKDATSLCSCCVSKETWKSDVQNQYKSLSSSSETWQMSDSSSFVERSCDSSADFDSQSSSTLADWGSETLSFSEKDASESSLSTVRFESHSDNVNSPESSDVDTGGHDGGHENTSSKFIGRSLEAGVQFESLADHLEVVLKHLRGVVTSSDRRLVSPFFRQLVRETADDREKEKTVNEGFLFHPQKLLQPKNCEYREGQEYMLLHHIQNGSYGDVFSALDKTTGFKCAAKKVPLASFSWEEVGTWSGLSSPRVLQLFGAVREGSNIILFMDLKTGSLAQLLKRHGSLPEDLCLHYHCQVLEALEHLHRRRVLHLDVKVDNVLLSEDGRDCFLCDFGLSEILDPCGWTSKALRGYGLRGTETHMAPEVAKGDPRCAKADVWSSCCMLLHMLNGCHPWTRYYAHPLCLTIVSEEPPLWEIPSDCSPVTTVILRAGLKKDPTERASATELKVMTCKALQAVGGFTSSKILEQQALQPTPGETSTPEWTSASSQERPVIPVEATSCSEDSPQSLVHWVSPWREEAQEEDQSAWEMGERDSDVESVREDRDSDWAHEEEYEGEGEEGGGGEEEGSDLESLRELGSDWVEEEDEWEPFHRIQILYGPKREKIPHPDNDSSLSESKSWGVNRIPLVPSPRHQELPMKCLYKSPASLIGSSEKDSEDSSDDLSSGVFSSYSGQTDKESFSVDWLVSTNQPQSCCFEGLGVDIWIEDFTGESLRIREKPHVKLGHVAMGISEQISVKTFSLATLDGKPFSPDEEVMESGLWLQCVPALDENSDWTWRIRDGKLEKRG